MHGHARGAATLVLIGIATASACAGSSTAGSLGSHPPARVVLLVDRAPGAVAPDAVRAAARAVLAVLTAADQVGLALVPADPAVAADADPLAVPVAALDQAQRARLLARIDAPPTERARPLYDVLAAIYTTMTDRYDTSRSNVIVAVVSGPNTDDAPGDDDAQLTGLVGELRVGASGANARPVHVVPIVLGPRSDVLASMRAVASATGNRAIAAAAPADAARATADALRTDASRAGTP